MSASKTRINSEHGGKQSGVSKDAALLSPFAWKSQPSALAPALRAKVNRNAPGPASQITFSTKVPHSINTEIVRDSDKAQRIRKAAI